MRRRERRRKGEEREERENIYCNRQEIISMYETCFVNSNKTLKQKCEKIKF